MENHELRFRDSYLIRIGVGMIAAIAALIAAAIAALYLFGYNPSVGPTGLWALLATFFAVALILIGIGQIVVRRGKAR